MFELTSPFTVNIFDVDVPMTTLPLRYTFEPSVDVPDTANEPSID